MGRLRWTPAAAADLDQINSYLRQRIRELKNAPFRGRPGREPGTRELVFAPLPYVAVYRTSGTDVQVLRIYHGAQDR